MRYRTRDGVFRAMLVWSLAGVLQGCGVPPPPDPDRPKPATAEQRLKGYQDCWNAFNEKKWDIFKLCYAPNATVRQLGFGTRSQISGPDAIAASAQDFAKSFPDERGEGQLILINGTHVAGISFLSSANIGPLIAPNGNKIAPTKKIGLLFAQEIEGDLTSVKEVREIGVIDSGTLAFQLGTSKTPARPVMDRGETMPKIVIGKDDDAEKKILEADKNAIAAWNKHDGEAHSIFVAEDCVFHDMTAPKDLNKVESYEMDQVYWSAFPDANIGAALTWAAGDYVVLFGNFNGTNDGDFPPMKLKKTGRRVSVPFLEFDRFSDGKLKEVWLFFDSANLAAQLAPPPATNK